MSMDFQGAKNPYIEEGASRHAHLEERNALLMERLGAELDQELLRRVALAMAKVNEIIVRAKSDTPRGPRGKYTGKKPDEILADAGVTFEAKPKLYLAYERTARLLAGIEYRGRGKSGRKKA